MGLVSRLGAVALDALYPPVCAACGAETDETGGLCAPCFRETVFLSGAVCDGCGAPLDALSGAETGARCQQCLDAPPVFDAARAAALYEGPMRRAILAFKHGDRIDLAPVLGGWMHRVGAEMLREADLIAPIPLHWRRRLARRFNQSAELARRLTGDSPRRFAPQLLRRARHTPPQEGRGRAARFANLRGAFAPGPDMRAQGARILLIDDVMTTGATLSAAAAVLKASGAARVEALVVARVAPGAETLI